MTAPGALVIGGDYRGLGIVRSLGRKGIPVWVAQDEHRLAGSSRYAQRKLRWPSESPEEQVRFLLRLADDHGLDDWVLFPTADTTAHLMGLHHTALSGHYRVTVSPWKVQEFAANKLRLYERAAILGIPYPETFSPTSEDDLQARVGDLAYPVILKPALKLDNDPLSSAKAWKVGSPAELVSRYAEARSYMPRSNIMVQELLPGGGEARFSYASVCQAGRPLASAVARRTRQFPTEFGRASTFVETIEDPGIAAHARRVLADLELDGLVEVEFHFDRRDRRFKLLDVNPRAWGWHSVGEAAGADFAHVAWQLAAGETPAPAHARPGVRWVRLTTDVPMAAREILKGGMRLRQYLRTLRPPIEGAIAAWDDPWPAVMEVPLILGTAIARLRAGSPI